MEHLLDATVKRLHVHGEIEITIDITAHLSPLSSAHTHSVGRYTFSPTHHVSASRPLQHRPLRRTPPCKSDTKRHRWELISNPKPA